MAGGASGSDTSTTSLASALEEEEPPVLDEEEDGADGAVGVAAARSRKAHQSSRSLACGRGKKHDKRQAVGGMDCKF